MKTIQPPTYQLPDEQNDNGQNEAADLIRGKLDKLYAKEPDAVTETIETEQTPVKQRSKHQKFMHELATSGKPYALIQMEWHNYYKSLPDVEKHQVWEEFYAAQEHKPQVKPLAQSPLSSFASGTSSAKPVTGSFDPRPSKPKPAPQTIGNIKKQITDRVKVRGKLSKKQHASSLIFGLSVGLFAMLILSFGLFNERVIAPFITPSRTVSDTPIIVDPGSAVGATDNKLVIPKINVEVPVVYDVETIAEADVQEGLERGVVHYVTTSNPGEQGGGAIFGHSSNNILNKGKYKFAFVLLSRLEKDDTFYIDKGGVRYVYKIYDKKIVSPSDVSVLGNVPGKTTMALITCDPPGTTINRLVVWGEQISPDPTKNVASTALQTDATAATLAGNPQSLWSRIWTSIF